VIGDHVVDNAAVGIAEQRVLRLARSDLAEIGSETPVDEVRRTWPGHSGFAEMTDVKNPDGIADSRMFCEHPGA
jgi:hypothetical protein